MSIRYLANQLWHIEKAFLEEDGANHWQDYCEECDLLDPDNWVDDPATLYGFAQYYCESMLIKDAEEACWEFVLKYGRSKL